jgi:glycosyltransferase involved in cell wall biosynthesis
MRRLRILQIFNRYLQYGGEEGSVFRIGDALQDAHDVEYFFGSTQELIGENHFDLLKVPFRSWHNLKAARRLRRYQEVGRFDLWQIHNIFPALSPSVYQTAFDLQIPIVHFLHNYRMSCTNGFFLNHGKPCERCIDGNFWPALQTACWRDSHLASGMTGLILRRFRSMGLFERVSAWIALSHASKTKHIQMGIPEERIHVVPHFYQPTSTPPPPCPSGDVLFLGRLSPEKGVDILLKAWAQIETGTRKLVIAGTGPEESKLRKLVADLHLRNVEFTGFIQPEQQEKFWRNSAFFVAPSIWDEPFGMVVLEAWSRGRPVVGFAKGSFPEMISEGYDGTLARQVTPQALAERISFLLKNPSLVEPWGRHGFAKLDHFASKSRWLSSMEAVYQSCIPLLN